MDGTKRTAFAAALFFLESQGFALPQRFPVKEVIEFCVSIAEENLRIAEGKNVSTRTVDEISVWIKELVSV